MARTSQDIERLFKAQKQIFLFSSWLLQQLDAQVYELNEKERRILFALSNGDLARHDRFVANAAERLKKILEEAAQLSAARDKVTSEFDRQRLMLKLMTERLAKMRGEENRARETQELYDYLDRQYG